MQNLMAKKDKIIKLFYTISMALFISTFIFLFSGISISILLSSLGSSIPVRVIFSTIVFIFVIILFLSYYFKLIIEYLTKLEEILTKLEELYFADVPFILMGIGCSALFIVIIASMPHYVLPAPGSFFGNLLNFSIRIIFVGTLMFIIFWSAKMSVESRVLFTLKKANIILEKELEKVEDNNQIDTNLGKYIYLTYKNIKKKIIEGLSLESSKESNSIPDSELKYTFKHYLPFYIANAGKEQLQFLKKALQTMKESIKENDEENDVSSS
jgi:hypothetical protein